MSEAERAGAAKGRIGGLRFRRLQLKDREDLLGPLSDNIYSSHDYL